MWTLECDGDLLQGKRVWLKPGSQHLLGRTKKETSGEQKHHIEHKSVSRQHLIICVSDKNKSRDGDLVRAEVKLTDDSRLGTKVNGQQLEKSSLVLPGQQADHTIQLGSYPQLFRIRWQPVVFTLAISSKHVKERLEKYKAQFEPLDISVSADFLSDRTTHVVSNQRNTAKSLRGLASASHLVKEAYLDEVLRATTRSAGSASSPLEVDFDGNWPTELPWVPLAGKEPNPKPADYLAPDTARSQTFLGYDFIFGLPDQFQNLLAPITTASGKALLHEISFGRTAAEEFVAYVRNIAGETGLISAASSRRAGSSSRKHVIVVQPTAPKGFEEYTTNLMKEVDRQLGQASIDQNEFLNAILTVDASCLQRVVDPQLAAARDRATPPSRESRNRPKASTAQAVSPPSGHTQPQDGSKHGQNETRNEGLEVPAKASSRRTAARSRFKGFDDFDPSALAKDVSEDDESLIANDFHQPDSPMEKRGPRASVDTFSRKRRDPPSDDGSMDEANMVNELLPGAAAMKRRRIERGQTNPPAQQETAVKESPGSKNQAMLARKRTQAAKAAEVNVLELAKQRREAEEEANRKDAESLEQALDGMDIADMKNLAQVEEMAILPRESRQNGGVNGGQNGSDRWDERWHGRKNFKKFRRKGTTGETPFRGHRVIVGLQEVTRHGFGMNGHWEDTVRKSDAEHHHVSEPQKHGGPRKHGRSHKDQAPVEISSDDNDEVDDDDHHREVEDDGDEVDAPSSFKTAASGTGSNPRRRGSKDSGRPSQTSSSSNKANTSTGNNGTNGGHSNNVVYDSFPSSRISTRNNKNNKQAPHLSAADASIAASASVSALDPESPVTTRSGKRVAPTTSSGSPSGGSAIKQPPSKRAKTTATSASASKPASKASSLRLGARGKGKARVLQVEDSDAEGSDEEDELKFTFGRKR